MAKYCGLLVQYVAVASGGTENMNMGSILSSGSCLCGVLQFLPVFTLSSSGISSFLWNAGRRGCECVCVWCCMIGWWPSGRVNSLTVNLLSWKKMVYPVEIPQKNAFIYSTIISSHPSRLLRLNCPSGGASPQKAKVSSALRSQCPSLCSLKKC